MLLTDEQVRKIEITRDAYEALPDAFKGLALKGYQHTIFQVIGVLPPDEADGFFIKGNELFFCTKEEKSFTVTPEERSALKDILDERTTLVGQYNAWVDADLPVTDEVEQRRNQIDQLEEKATEYLQSCYPMLKEFNFSYDDGEVSYQELTPCH